MLKLGCSCVYLTIFDSEYSVVMTLQLSKRGNMTFSDSLGKFSLRPQGVLKGVKNVFFPSVPTILNNHSLDLSEILHDVTTTQAKKCDILGFSRKILVASPGEGVGRGQKWVFSIRSHNSQ